MQRFRSAFRRFQLKYLGGVPEGTYERYGIQGTPIKWYTNHNLIAILMGCGFIGSWSSYDLACTREEFLDNIELNRRAFYGQRFASEKDKNIGHIFENPYAAMSTVDPETGIKRDADGRYAADEAELAARLGGTVITPDMLEELKKFRKDARE